MDIMDKIRWAKGCYQVNRDLLLMDIFISKHLTELKKAILASRNEMKRIGMLDKCRICSEEGGGSCCGSGIENRYSGTLLLLNLMLDLSLPEKRTDPGNCFFLGKDGCVLLARHVICVNYVCRDINATIGTEGLAKLREHEGTELELIFLLDEKIKEILAHAG
ncbi:MAG: hypothetical protein JW882_13870 [Deltaproteobacteria bacterium]|nr:hypothetical protein [Deltaproteobacteria bacterium]